MYGSCNRVVFKFCSHDQKDVVSSAGQGVGGHPDRGRLCDRGSMSREGSMCVVASREVLRSLKKVGL